MFPPCFLLSHLANHLPLAPLCPSSPMYGFHTMCGFHTDDHSIMKKRRWENAQDLLSSFHLKSQPYWAPGNLLLFSTSCFFPVDVWYWADRPSLTKHKTSHGDPRWVCTGTSSSWCRSSISEVSPVHLCMETICGERAPTNSWVRLFATNPIPSTPHHAGLTAADGYTSKEKKSSLS